MQVHYARRRICHAILRRELHSIGPANKKQDADLTGEQIACNPNNKHDDERCERIVWPLRPWPPNSKQDISVSCERIVWPVRPWPPSNKHDNDVRCDRIFWLPKSAWPAQLSTEPSQEETISELNQEPISSSQMTPDTVVFANPLENHLPPCNPIYSPCFRKHLVHSLYMSNELKCAGDQAQAQAQASPTPPPSPSHHSTIEGRLTCPSQTSEAHFESSETSEQIVQEIIPAPYQQRIKMSKYKCPPQNYRRDKMQRKKKTLSPPYQEIFSVSAAMNENRYGGRKRLKCLEQPRCYRLRPPCEECNNPCFENRKTQPPALSLSPKVVEDKKPSSSCSKSNSYNKKGYRPIFFLAGLLFGGAVVGLYNAYA